MIIGVVSGGFDPLHAGHARMLRDARKFSTHLVVLVNTDQWLIRKKGYVSVPYAQRAEMVSYVCPDAEVIAAKDDDGTVVESLVKLVRYKHPEARVVFMNGGDRRIGNVPEESVSGVEFLYGVGGGDKTNSSSLIAPSGYLGRCERTWGHYDDHLRSETCVFKTLYIRSGQSTSLQRHFGRSETWLVASGVVEVEIGARKFYMLRTDSCTVPAETWHRIRAIDGDAVVREMQHGKFCREDDIERADR